MTDKEKVYYIFIHDYLRVILVHFVRDERGLVFAGLMHVDGSKTEK